MSTQIEIKQNSHIAAMCETTRPTLCANHLAEARGDGDIICVYSEVDAVCDMCRIDEAMRGESVTKRIEGIYAVRQDNNRHIYWNTTAAMWVEQLEDASEFVTRKAAEEIVAEHGGIVEDRSWVLLGHCMFIGENTLYYRGTCKGIGGSSTVAKAMHFTEQGAKSNMIPPYEAGRTRPGGRRYGWELIHVSEANDCVEVEDHYVDRDGITRTRLITVKLDN